VRCFDIALVLKASATIVRAQGLGDLDRSIAKHANYHSVGLVSEVEIINLSILKIVLHRLKVTDTYDAEP
jgi:type III secretion system FlhB-like substrate exporter